MHVLTLSRLPCFHTASGICTSLNHFSCWRGAASLLSPPLVRRGTVELSSLDVLNPDTEACRHSQASHERDYHYRVQLLKL